MSINTKFMGASALAFAAATFATPSAVLAQTTTTTPAAEEADEDAIIVTARRRDESLQDIPLTVTAFSAEGLREKNITNTEDLVAHTPSLQIRPGGAQRSNGTFFLRGQGASFGTRPSVVVYTNEVPAFGPGIANGTLLGNNTQFYDLQSIQVAKGPQGTLFGASTTGGAVLLTTQRPTNKFEGWIEGKIGNFNYKEVTGAINIPIITDHIMLRVAGNLVRRDGFTVSSATGQANDDKNKDSYRISLLVKPGDGFETLTIFRDEHINEAASGVVLQEFNEGYINGSLIDRSNGITTGANAGPAAPVFAFGVAQPLATPVVRAASSLFSSPTYTGAITQGCNGTIAATEVAARAACIADRTGRVAAIVAASKAEVARVNAGGSIRQNNTGTIGYTTGNTQQITNITTIRPGSLGSFLGEVTIKNIFATNRVGIASSSRSVFGGPLLHGDTQNGVDLIAGVVTPSQKFSQRKFFDNFSEEFQLSGHSTVLDWQFGYYKNHYENALSAAPAIFSTFGDALDFTTPFGVGAIQGTFTLNEVINDTGYFGQVTVRPIDRLSITAGYRKSKFTRTAENAPALITAAGLVPGVSTVANPIDQGAPSYNFAVDYKPNDNLLIYATHRKGFKAGGSNLRPSVDPATLPGYIFTYAPETVLDYEAGIKYSFRTGGVRGHMNLAYYHSDYTDIQRNQVLALPTGVFTQVSNIGAAKIDGLELDTEFRVGDRLTVGISGSYTNARYTAFLGNDYTVSFTPGSYTNAAGQTTVAYAASPNINQPYQGTPKFQMTINARYAVVKDDRIGEIALSGNYYRQSSVVLDDNIVQDPLKVGFQPAYDTVNARIDWLNFMGKPIDLAINVTNLTQSVYKVGAANGLGSIGIVGAFYNEPRMISGSVRFRF
jgi:iron complex outermembrane recepter protein